GCVGDADYWRSNSAENQGVEEFAHAAGSDQSENQSALPRAFLEFNQHPGVGKLAHQESAGGGNDNLPDWAKGPFQGFLPVIELSRRQLDHDPETEHGEERQSKSHQNRAARCLQSIDFGNDVAQNVGQREEEEPAVSNEWTEADAFRSANIRKNHDRTHHGEDRGEVGRTGRSEYRSLG